MDEYIKREDALDTVLFALVGTGLQSTAIYALRDVPAADVVPKSEYDEVLSSWQKIHDSYDADCIEHYKYGRAEVAREIFEEIEEAIEKCKYNQSTPFGIEERYNPYAIIKQVAELKKKYTEIENG